MSDSLQIPGCLRISTRIKPFKPERTPEITITIPYQLAISVFDSCERVTILIDKDAHEIELAIVPAGRGVKLQKHSGQFRIQYTPKPDQIKLIAGLNLKIWNGHYSALERDRLLSFSLPLSYELNIMNKSTQSSLINMNSTMFHVFQVIPLQEHFTVNQIVSELARTGKNYSFNSIIGYLKTLTERKLIKETKDGYIRTVKQSEPKLNLIQGSQLVPVTNNSNENTEKAVMTTKTAPLELLAELSQKARELADSLDNAALEIEQQFQASEAQSAKLKQLQALLKDISV